jgi:hypothetical protein
MKRIFKKHSPIYDHTPLLYYVYNSPPYWGYIYLILVSFIIIIRKGVAFQSLGVKQAFVSGPLFRFKTPFYAAKTGAWPVTHQLNDSLRVNRGCQQGTGSGAAVLGLPDMLWRHGRF